MLSLHNSITVYLCNWGIEESVVYNYILLIIVSVTADTKQCMVIGLRADMCGDLARGEYMGHDGKAVTFSLSSRSSWTSSGRSARNSRKELPF
jgi:hypothetical protein